MICIAHQLLGCPVRESRLSCISQRSIVISCLGFTGKLPRFAHLTAQRCNILSSHYTIARHTALGEQLNHPCFDLAHCFWLGMHPLLNRRQIRSQRVLRLDLNTKRCLGEVDIGNFLHGMSSLQLLYCTT